MPEIRKRQGNLLITLAIFAFLTLSFATILTSASARRASMRNKAINAGAMDSYITVSNLCADYFAQDFESGTASVAIASVGYVGNLGDPEVVKERAYSVFETGVDIIQNGTGPETDKLWLEDGDGDEWVYVLTDPNAVIAASGITDEATLEYLESLLSRATVKIIVEKDLGITRDEGDSLTMTTGDVVAVSDIAYRVVLERGLVRITQDYILSGAKAFAVYDGSPYATITIDSSIAENTPQNQVAETRRLTKS